KLEDVLERFIAAFHYAGAALVDQNGKLRFEVARKHPDPHGDPSLTTGAPAAGSVRLSDLQPDSSTHQPWILLTISLPGSGALILDINPSEFLYPYLASWPTASRTGETMLVRRDATGLVYLSSGKDPRNTPLWSAAPWKLPLPETDRPGSLQQWIDP